MVYHAVYTAHAQNTHVVSIMITRFAISYRNSNETIAIFTLLILSPRPNLLLFLLLTIRYLCLCGNGLFKIGFFHFCGIFFIKLK